MCALTAQNICCEVTILNLTTFPSAAVIATRRIFAAYSNNSQKQLRRNIVPPPAAQKRRNKFPTRRSFFSSARVGFYNGVLRLLRRSNLKLTHKPDVGGRCAHHHFEFSWLDNPFHLGVPNRQTFRRN